MKFRSLKNILLLSFLLISLFVKSEPYSISRIYECIDISNGLPQNTVRCIEKDNYGFIWFGTDYGLCRFDGYDFVYYNASQSGNLLIDNRIVDVLADSRGLIWITTKNGVQILNTNSGKFIELGNIKVQEVLSKDVVEIIEYNGNIWVATSNEGVYEIGIENELSNVKIKSHLTFDKQDVVISCLIKGDDDNIYLGTNKDVYFFNKEQKKFMLLELENYISFDVQVLFIKNNVLWVGTSNGLFSLNTETKALTWYAHDVLIENSIPHSHITSIGLDATGSMLIGTLGGLCRYNKDEDNFSNINIFPSKDKNIHDVFVSELCTDRSGNVWVGTEKTGVVHYNVFSKRFLSFTEDLEDYTRLNSDIINTIYASENRLWVGTAGDGLYIYDINNKDVKHFQLDANNPYSISSDFISSIVKDGDENIWIGTWGMGLQRMTNKNPQKFTSYSEEHGLSNDFISCLYVNSKGELIVGTRGGLFVYNKKTDLFETIELSVKNYFDPWKVGCLQEDDEGYLWVGTTNGLHRFKADLISAGSNYKLSKYDVVTFKKTNEKNSLPNNYITSIENDKNGNIWIGTYGNGIGKCIVNSDGNYVFENYTEGEGLSNNVVYKVLSDSKNDLWISTENGLSHFKVKDKLFVNYYKKDGLRNNQYYWSAGFKAESGDLFFGGLNGLNFFNPDSINSYPDISQTYITKLNVANNVVKAGVERHGIIPFNKSVFTTDTIVLSYKDNVFSFEFSALPYYLSTKIRYEYQLEGVDQNWVEVGSDRRMASYTNLNGGEYLFKVRSTNLDGEWNKEPTSVLLVINPPFWKTSWFKILLLIALVFLVSAYIRYKSYRITEQKKRLERIVEDRTDEIKVKNEQLEQNSKILIARNQQLALRQEEIEKQKNLLEQQNKEIISQRDQLIILNEEVESIHQKRMQFFTNISHEFRTPLTLIISPIEKMLNESFNYSKENISHTIKYIKRNAERLLMLTNEILTFRKLEAGKVRITLSQGNLSSLIEDVAEAFRSLADQKNIKFNVAVDFNLENVWYDKSKFENILFNLLSNAIKYTPEKGQVSLSANKVKNPHGKPYLLINIQDNGIGISKDIQTKVFERFFRDTANQHNGTYGTGIGLSLTKQMVEILNGTITLESELNKGSSFKVTLPLEQSEFPVHDISSNDIKQQITLEERVRLMTDLEINKPVNLKDKYEINENKSSILVVEDNSDLRDFLVESLSDNFIVNAAEDGVQGLKLVQKNDFDLVVSDVMMPNMNGIELCKMLKNDLQTSHIPVILLTAKNQEEDYVEGLESGADDFITKPFNLAVLQAKMNSLIENRKKIMKRFQQTNPETEEPELSSISSLDEEFMGKINQVISDFYTDPTFDIDTFSSKMYVSRSLLYKKLKALTNVSPNEYITIYRLKKSISLLKSKKHQVSEVAFMVGFNDPKYFSRVFKKFYNCSPSSYLE